MLLLRSVAGLCLVLRGTMVKTLVPLRTARGRALLNIAQTSEVSP